MKTTPRWMLGLLLGAVLPAAYAQSTPPAPVPAVALPITPAHRQAAQEFVRAAHAEQRIDQSRAVMIDLMLRSNPRLDPYRDVLAQWTDRFMSWDVLGPQIVELYATSFSEHELHELTRFFATPLGQKWLAVTPDLTRALMELGSGVGREHLAELEAMLRARALELQAQPQAAAPGSADAETQATAPLPAPEH